MNSLGAHGNGFKYGGRGPSDAIAYPNIYQAFGSQAQAKVQQIQSSLAAWAQSQAANALNASALQSIYQVQASLIITKNGERETNHFLGFFGNNLMNICCSSSCGVVL
jgi:choline dehydrogenase